MDGEACCVCHSLLRQGRRVHRQHPPLYLMMEQKLIACDVYVVVMVKTHLSPEP